MKGLLTMAIGGTTLAVVAIVALLALFLIPGGLGILTIEWERINRWFHQACKLLLKIQSKPKQESLSC